MSQKLIRAIMHPHNLGIFTEQQSTERGMRLAVGVEGSIEQSNWVQISLLVDREDGGIVDAKFCAYGHSALIGAAEIACDLLIGKNYDQAGRISADLIDQSARDRSDHPAFAEVYYPHLNCVTSAIELACEECLDLPLPNSYVAPPAPSEIGEIREGGYPGWDAMDSEKRMALIRQVLEQEVVPYIALDGGGVELIELNQEHQVIIAYKGACTSCYSSVGATLSYIQQVIQARVHPSLIVVPQL